MGIACSPDIFQENMSDLIQQLKFVTTNLDDLLVILCSTLEYHLLSSRRPSRARQQTHRQAHAP
jgi:hypothetical protein